MANMPGSGEHLYILVGDKNHALRLPSHTASLVKVLWSNTHQVLIAVIIIVNRAGIVDVEVGTKIVLAPVVQRKHNRVTLFSIS